MGIFTAENQNDAWKKNGKHPHIESHIHKTGEFSFQVKKPRQFRHWFSYRHVQSAMCSLYVPLLPYGDIWLAENQAAEAWLDHVQQRFQSHLMASQTVFPTSRLTPVWGLRQTWSNSAHPMRKDNHFKPTGPFARNATSSLSQPHHATLRFLKLSQFSLIKQKFRLSTPLSWNVSYIVYVPSLNETFLTLLRSKVSWSVISDYNTIANLSTYSIHLRRVRMKQ